MPAVLSLMLPPPGPSRAASVSTSPGQLRYDGEQSVLRPLEVRLSRGSIIIIYAEVVFKVSR